LMIRLMHGAGGEESPLSRGTWVDATGHTTVLRQGDFKLEPLDGWKSPTTGAYYPLKWRVKVPRIGLNLETEVPVETEEHLSDYSDKGPQWEGPVYLKGVRAGRNVTGKGFLRLRGYAKKDRDFVK